MGVRLIDGKLLSAEQSEGLTVRHSKVSQETLALINQIRAEHRAKLKQPDRYNGLRSNRSSRRREYRDCVRVGDVRKLSEREIAELQAHVDRCRR